MSERLTVSEFARRASCDEKQVRRAIEQGKLSKGKDGRLAAADIGSAWRKPNRRTVVKDAGKAASPPARTIKNVRTPAPKRKRRVTVRDETPAQAAERIVNERGMLSLPEALSLKENYLARRQQLEYDLKAGTVVVAADVAAAVGAEYAGVRRKLLAIPAEQAAEIHRLRTVPEVEDLLRSVMVEALGRLTLDGPPSS